MEKYTKREAVDRNTRETLVNVIIENYCSIQTQTHYKEIIQKLGPECIRGFGIDNVTSEMIKRDELAKIKDVYEKLINLSHDHLEFIPEHIEKKLDDPIMQDFHHYCSGIYGYDTYQVKIPDQWTVNDEGKKEIDNYVGELKQKYEPRKKEIIFKRLFSKKP